jgi:hypothetical protein
MADEPVEDAAGDPARIVSAVYRMIVGMRVPKVPAAILAERAGLRNAISSVDAEASRACSLKLRVGLGLARGFA